jgi:SAM-dependent methyltransferase
VIAGRPAMRVAGTAQVVRFNWPKYLTAAAIVASAVIASIVGAPGLVVDLLWAACAPGLAWTVTSLVATWWVYDHRRVYEQLTAGLAGVGEWAAVHAGFDRSAAVLRASIGRHPAAVAEIAVAPGPSLRRARRLSGHPATDPPATDPPATDPPATDPPARGLAGGLPLAWGSLDSIFITFAVHEVRDLAGQRALFSELRDALRPGGRLVITEHPRDLATFAVYGPGAMHFQPLATWLARAAEAGLSIDGHATITPLVHRIVCRR